MPAQIERRKMAKTVFQSLKKHIIREREKRKQEREADAAIERQKREAELHRKKEQEHSLTLEQTKEEIAKLEATLEEYKRQKHELFAQLKKVLEDESKRKMKEQQNDLAIGHYYQTMAGPTHPVFLQGTGHMGRAMMFKPPQAPTPSTLLMHPMSLKRARSPSPPSSAQTALYHYGQGDSSMKFVPGFGPSQPCSFSGPAHPLASLSTGSNMVPQQSPSAMYSASNSAALAVASSSAAASIHSAATAAARFRADKGASAVSVDDKLKATVGGRNTGSFQGHTAPKGSIVTGYPVHLGSQQAFQQQTQQALQQQALQQQTQQALQQQQTQQQQQASLMASVGNSGVFGATLRHTYSHHDPNSRYY